MAAEAGNAYSQIIRLSPESLLREEFADASAERIDSERLCQNGHTRFELAVVEERVLGEAYNEQDLEVGTVDPCRVRHLPPV